MTITVVFIAVAAARTGYPFSLTAPSVSMRGISRELQDPPRVIAAGSTDAVQPNVPDRCLSLS